MVGPGEPEWLSSDRDKLRVVLADRASTCPRCRTRREEWGEWATGDDGKRVFRRFSTPPYVAKTITDPGCEALDKALEKQRSHSKDTSGVVAVLEVNPAAAR